MGGHFLSWGTSNGGAAVCLYARVGLLGLLAVGLLLAAGTPAASAERRSTERVSVAYDGSEANETSYWPAISADGRYVAFTSRASNLVPDDTNGGEDVFVHDRLTGITERVSVDSAGNEGDDLSGGWGSAISSDGWYVAFDSRATNLVPDDTNGKSDTFVHDRLTGTTERVSVDSAGNQADDGSDWGPAISGDGSYVAFASYTTNLVPGDTNGESDVFVHDRSTGITERVNVDSAGNEANGYSGFLGLAISSDGWYVAFDSWATNLVPGDTNETGDIFLHDRLTGITERVSVDSAGNQANGWSDVEAISPNGRYVAFTSPASNLVPNDTNSCPGWQPSCLDVFIHDRQTGATDRVSVDSTGNQGNAESLSPAISGDVRYVAFWSKASNLVPDDTNGTDDVFLHDRQTGVTERVSVDSAGNQGNGSSGGTRPAIGIDGSHVAFESHASNLVAGDTNGFADVFVDPEAPDPVGGIAALPEVSNSTSRNYSALAGLAAAAVVALGVGGWYARRRWLR